MTRMIKTAVKKFFAMTVTGSLVITSAGSIAMGGVDPGGSYKQIDEPLVSERSTDIIPGPVLSDESIDEILEKENISEDLEEKKGSFVDKGEAMDIKIGKDPEKGITMEGEECGSFTMNLPEEISADKGRMEEGEVVYDSDDEDASVQVRTEKGADEDQGSIVRSLINIDSPEAPDSYTFRFEMEGGQKLMFAEQMNSPEAVPGCVYIAEKMEPVAEIQAPWARDAEGNPVPTHFEISGNDLIQKVDFDEDTVFPVVADPAIGGFYYVKVKSKIKNKWGKYKKTSEIMNTSKSKGGTLGVDKVVSFSGSVSGNIKGIVTIGVGATISSAIRKTWEIEKNKRVYLGCRAKYMVEKGVREKRRMSSGQKVSSNKFKVKRPLGWTEREYKIFEC